MGLIRKMPTPQLIAEKRQLLIRAVADVIDSRSYPILDVLQAKTEVDKISDSEIEMLHCSDLEVLAEEIVAPFRTFYNEDIERFRNEYLNILALDRDIDMEKSAPFIESKYTDDFILDCLRQALSPEACAAHDRLSDK